MNKQQSSSQKSRQIRVQDPLATKIGVTGPKMINIVKVFESNSQILIQNLPLQFILSNEYFL